MSIRTKFLICYKSTSNRNGEAFSASGAEDSRHLRSGPLPPGPSSSLCLLRQLFCEPGDRKHRHETTGSNLRIRSHQSRIAGPASRNLFDITVVSCRISPFEMHVLDDDVQVCYRFHAIETSNGGEGEIQVEGADSAATMTRPESSTCSELHGVDLALGDHLVCAGTLA